jgi:hypothetical protein
MLVFLLAVVAERRLINAGPEAVRPSSSAVIAAIEDAAYRRVVAMAGRSRFVRPRGRKMGRLPHMEERISAVEIAPCRGSQAAVRLGCSRGFDPPEASGNMLFDSPIRAVAGDLPRKWLSDGVIDLIVWYNHDGSIYGFQILYDLQDLPKALTYRPGIGFSHDAVGAGEDFGMYAAAILTPAPSFNIAAIRKLFEARSTALPEEITRFVLGAFPIVPEVGNSRDAVRRVPRISRPGFKPARPALVEAN